MLFIIDRLVASLQKNQWMKRANLTMFSINATHCCVAFILNIVEPVSKLWNHTRCVELWSVANHAQLQTSNERFQE